MDNSNSILALTVAFVVLVCLSAFFSACEMAFSSLNRIKLKNLAVKSKRAAMALKLLDMYDKILSTALIGNNLVNIVASSLATLLFVSLFGAKGVSLSALIVTVLVLVFGDISPKTLAKESPEQCALSFAPLLRFFIVIFTPLNYLAAAWKKLIVKLFPPKLDRSITEDELLTFVEEVRQEGGINKQEEQMIRHAIEFDEITASEIFTPRVDVAAISQTATVGEIDNKFAETGFSRLPVFNDTIDNITGVILLKDFHHLVVNGLKAPAEIIKPVVFVTKTMKIAKLLRTLQQRQSHLAVVVDEFGGTLGIVTIEDIVEELVGEIWDEHEEVVEPVKKINDSSFVVMGSVNFKDMLEYITAGSNNGEDIPETTMGNWIMEKLGGLPRRGDELSWGNLKIRVSRVVRQRVMEVIVVVDATDEHGKE